MQSCGQTTVEPALQEVTWGLQKGNELKKKKSISRCLLTSRQVHIFTPAKSKKEGSLAWSRLRNNSPVPRTQQNTSTENAKQI